MFTQEPWDRALWDRATVDFIDEQVEVHPKGLIYLPHEALRTRLNQVFGAGYYRFIPVGDPQLGANECIWRYRLEFRDGTYSEAYGHAQYIKNNPSYSYGDALETCKSDAFARCCKDVGVGLQVWNRDYLIRFMQEYAINVPLKDSSRTVWRRKDRPPVHGERLSRDQAAPFYERKPTIDEENREHIKAIAAPEKTLPLTLKPKPMSQEESFAPPAADDEEWRRHMEENEAFSDDARED